jgi:hypothetical protein
MILDQRIIPVSRDLTKLDINFKQRKEIIKSCYNFWGKWFLFPRELDSAIEKANEKDLKGEPAYNLIIENLKKHDKYLCQKLSESDQTSQTY